MALLLTNAVGLSIICMRYNASWEIISTLILLNSILQLWYNKRWFIINQYHDIDLSRIYLAPMAGYTNVAFRILCNELGFEKTYTEFIKDDERYTERSYIAPVEPNVAAQIMGNDPQKLLALAKKLLSQYSNIKEININMGCPNESKILDNEGGALLSSPNLIARIIDILSSKIDIPITIKIRKGFDFETENYIQIGMIAQQNGAKAVILHGRYVSQLYSRCSDLECIKELKSCLTIPVIGNGDINFLENTKRMMDYTKCDAVMVGRSALKNPELVLGLLSTEERKKAIALRYIELANKYKLYIDFARFKVSLLTMLSDYKKKSIRLKSRMLKCDKFSDLVMLLNQMDTN